MPLSQAEIMQGEIGRLDVNNPNYILELGVGPPAPNLVPQHPGTGAVLSGTHLLIELVARRR